MSDLQECDEMPEWPREFRRGETVNEWKAAEHERARAEAALARLRVCERALHLIAHEAEIGVAGDDYYGATAKAALLDIGPLPPRPGNAEE